MGDFFISAAELWDRKARGEALRVFDVRRAEAIQPGSRFLPGSRWRNHMEALEWSANLPLENLIVLNCMHGHNVSQTAAARLRQAGFNARVLDGGVEGWLEAGLPTLVQSQLCPLTAPPSLWVTRVNPKIDRVACPWLISRFIDPDATFYFAEPDWVIEIAGELAGIAFDTPGAPVEHEGEHCSFDTLLREFDLNDPALDGLAVIVRGADTDRIDLAPEAAGLLAVMLGSTAMGGSDHDVMYRGFPVYDALYARLRFAAAGTHGLDGDGTSRG